MGVSRLLFCTTYILTEGVWLQVEIKENCHHFWVCFFFFFSQGSEVVNSVAGWQNEDGPTCRICLSLVFVVLDSGATSFSSVCHFLLCLGKPHGAGLGNIREVGFP